MQNSATQLRNILDAFRVKEVHLAEVARAPAARSLMERCGRLARQVLGTPARLPDAPVLLVDDMIDSGWTLTLAGLMMQQHGSGVVYPFALAKASPRGD
jgi:predicted amidophosphoribosyltransferase